MSLCGLVVGYNYISVMMSDATEQVIVVAIDDNAHSEYAITYKLDICLRLRLKVAARPG